MQRMYCALSSRKCALPVPHSTVKVEGIALFSESQNVSGEYGKDIVRTTFQCYAIPSTASWRARHLSSIHLKSIYPKSGVWELRASSAISELLASQLSQCFFEDVPQTIGIVEIMQRLCQFNDGLPRIIRLGSMDG